MANTEVGSAFVSVYPKLTNEWSKIGGDAAGKMGSGFSAKSATVAVAAGNLVSKAVNAAVEFVLDDLDEGIAKSDLMKQFPKVMENLGFSTSLAEQSIKDIMTHLQGLPTATQDLLPFVSELAAITNDLEKSTKVGLAFNDMLVAAGASSGDASRAMEMFSKMLASGEYNAQRWQSILEVMPGQLGQVAKEMLGASATAEDLGVALSNGEISFDDLLAAIIRMDTEGSESFKSFEDQAHNSSEGIQTSIDNLHNKIETGWANIIDAIGSENIQQLIDDNADAIKRFMDQVAWFIDDVQTWPYRVEKGMEQINISFNLGVDNLYDTVEGGVFKIGDVLSSFGRETLNDVDLLTDNLYNGVESTVRGIAGFLGIDLDQIEADIIGTDSNIEGDVSSTWSFVSSTISDEMDEAVRSVSDGVLGIEGLFAGMQISLPSLPTLNMTQTGSSDPMDWLKGNTASVNMWWGATGGYFDSATFIGVGEKGGELLLPESGGLMDPFADAVAERVEDNGGEYVVAWLSDNLPYIIEHFTPTVGQRDFDRMARRATA